MTFRGKIFYIILAIGLIPALAALIISAFLLKSTLNRIGAAGVQSSVEAARSMVEANETNMSKLLSGTLEGDIPWDDKVRLGNWRETNKLDLVYKISEGKFAGSTSDSINIAILSPDSLPSKTGIYHWRAGRQSIFICSIENSGDVIGCGLIMPDDYAENGMLVAGAASASASLSIYKTFSLKLLSTTALVAIIFILGAGFILSRFISRQLVKPLEKLTGGARRLGAGDLNYRVALSGDDEFARLAGSFNRMAGEIDENQKKLIEAEKLAAWREVARRIAHEIKNPLTPMAIELYRLKDMLGKANIEDSDKADIALEAIDGQINVLRELAGQFSTFAKEPELKKVDCSITGIITQSVDLYSNYKNVMIRQFFADGLPLQELDQQMMGRLFGNIIKNSIEASPDDIVIDITVDLDKDGVKIIIKDNGPGFPDEKLKNIDRPYFTTKKSGTGLGLAIIKKIVEEHGGALRLYNDNGAVTEITLPVEI